METGDKKSPVVIPLYITRKFVTSNPDFIFLYANDYLNRGCLGQAWQLANEPNTFRIPTCYKYCANPKFFQDVNYVDWIPLIDEAFDNVPRDGRIIIPTRKIGRGCARLQEFGPKILAYIEHQIKQIAYPNIEIDYYGFKYPPAS